MKALLLVDIQNDFCPGGALEVPKGDEVVAVANKLIASGEYDFIVASLDWHSADNVSFAVNHKGKQPFEEINIVYDGKKVRQRLWPVHCVAGTAGADFHPDLSSDAIDHIICKGTNREIDSYSAFFDNARLQETGLMNALTEQAAKRGESVADIELSVCGLATDYCVAATAKDARDLGLKTELIVDGCRAVNIGPSDEIRTLRELQGIGVRLITSRERLGEQLQPEREQALSRSEQSRGDRHGEQRGGLRC